MSMMLLESFSYIDDQFLENCEKKPHKRIAFSVAACLVAFAIGLGVFFHRPTEPTIDIDTLYPAEQFIINYNQVDENSFHVDRSLKYFALFSEQLLDDKVDELLPLLADDTAERWGYACFLMGTGEVEWADLTLTKPSLPQVHIRLMKRNLFLQNFDEVTPSRIAGDDGIDVFAIEERSDKGIAMSISFCLNEQMYVNINSFAQSETEDDTKQWLRDIVAAYVLRGRDLTIEDITPKKDWTTYFIDKELTFGEAKNDPEFGKYFPSEVPDGFTKESFNRTNHPNIGDFLSGLWYKELNELRWQIRYLTKNDERRIVAPSETEKFDLSLYPIPRADSVPDNLRETVDNPIFRIEELTLELVKARAYSVEDAGDVNGPRMHFSVLYDEKYLVEVSAKGVSPEWVYEQLKAI